MEAILEALREERPLWLLLLVSVAIAAALAAPLVDLPFVLGMGPFWDNPRGTIGGSVDDISGIVAGYRYFVHTRLGFPIFYTPNLGWPEGTNIIFTDSIPLVALAGWLASQLAGGYVNPYGAWVFLCLILPAPLMTWVTHIGGQRNLIAALAAAVLASCAPVLLWRWGHISLMGQFVIVGALGLYLKNLKWPTWRHGVLAWTGWLSLALLVHVYLFVMAGAVFVASLAQRWWLARIDRRQAAVELAIAAGALMALMVLAGHIGPHNVPSTAWGYGHYSLNLLSPIYPQKSGLFPAFGDIVDATGGQYEGFSYLGFGLLVLTVATLPAWFSRRRQVLHHHGALIAVFAAFVAFALSHRVYLGSTLLLEIPLKKPGTATEAAGPLSTLVRADMRALFDLPLSIGYLVGGTFRSSGRFFWPIVYALSAAGIVGALRYLPRAPAVAVIAVSILLQWLDVQPLRAQIAASIRRPVPPAIEVGDWGPRIAHAKRVMVYPSYHCADGGNGRRVSMAIQLLSAKANIPINAVYNTRDQANCLREQAQAVAAPTETGVLYVYLATTNRWEFLPVSDAERECRPFKDGVFCQAR